jgi:hypothetical protein
MSGAEASLAVVETIYRYAVGIDTRDFDLYGSIFADEVDIDFSSYSGRPAARMTREAWVGMVRPLFLGLAATQHSMTNPLPVVDGDTATCRMYIYAHHVLDAQDPSSWFTIGGYYDDTLQRDDRAPAGWLLTGVTLTELWRQGDASIMVTARERGKARLQAEGPG